MVIDFHAHIYPPPVAAKILPAARRKLKVDVPGSGAPQDLKGHMSRSGIARSVLLPLAKGREDVSSLNDWILSVSDEGLIPFGAIHPFMENLEAEAGPAGWLRRAGGQDNASAAGVLSR